MGSLQAEAPWEGEEGASEPHLDCLLVTIPCAGGAGGLGPAAPAASGGVPPRTLAHRSSPVWTAWLMGSLSEQIGPRVGWITKAWGRAPDTCVSSSACACRGLDHLRPQATTRWAV